MSDAYDPDIAAWPIQQAELLLRRWAALLTVWIGYDALDREAA